MSLRPSHATTCLIGLIAILCSPVFALSDDRSKPIQITSDTSLHNDKTGVTTYTGNVRITQGSMVITGDIVKIITANRKFTKAIVNGKPGTLRQRTDEGKEVKARAEHMEYHAANQKIVLRGNAELQQDANRFASEDIVYQTDTGIVEAGKPDGSSRVEITIMPEEIEQQ